MNFMKSCHHGLSSNVCKPQINMHKLTEMLFSSNQYPINHYSTKSLLLHLAKRWDPNRLLLVFFCIALLVFQENVPI